MGNGCFGGGGADGGFFPFYITKLASVHVIISISSLPSTR